jgi:hypothetical protein
MEFSTDAESSERSSQDSVASHASTNCSLRCEPFQYSQLDHETDSIRVLEIIPDPDESIIRCQMRRTTMSESTYRCLSYTWLPSHPTHEVEVNSSVLEIGDNLYQFLRAYRAWQRDGNQSSSPTFGDPTDDKSPSLWIDAICIDQSNVEEKNHQVRQMGTIYKKAQDVVIWLGVLDQSLLDFLEMAKELSGSIRKDFSQVDKTLDSYTRDLLRCGISNFWSLSYWNRTWIVQEIMLLQDKPTDLLILITTDLIKMSALCLSFLEVKMLVYENGWGILPRGEMYCGSRVFKEEKLFAPGTWTSLPDIFRHFRGSSCSDKRDRIFALLSLTEEEPRITVDYEVSTLELFRNVMEQYMDGKTIDELLLLGAHLIEGLELRRSPLEREQYTAFNIGSQRPSLNLTRVQSRATSATAVSVPAWTDAILEIYDNLSKENPHPEFKSCLMLCIYVTIFDAEDVHVFEYAIEEHDAFVRVKYARMHEFIQDQPVHLRCRGTLARIERELRTDDLVWLTLPSENVYYYRMMNYTDQTFPAPIRTWFGPEYCAEYPSPPFVLESKIKPHNYLRTARRFWVESLSLIGNSVKNAAFMFPAAKTPPADLMRMVLWRVGDSPVLFQEPPTVRGTLVHCDASESENTIKDLEEILTLFHDFLLTIPSCSATMRLEFCQLLYSLSQ